MSKDFFYPLRVLHGRFHEWRINVWPWVKKRINNPKAVFLVMTPEHGNLGDHAIAQSEKILLKELQIPFFEITDKETKILKKNDALHVMNGRSVLIHGGGNLGTLWFDVETLTRNIIEANPKSRMLAFPNTIFYEDTDWGNKEKEESIKVYNSHNDLYLFAREQISFCEMSRLYKHVRLVPDMVLRLDESKKSISRDGCILCLRKDREKTRSENAEKIIRSTAARLFGEMVTDRDMAVQYSITVSQRDEELEKQYDAFRHSKLVITDRLHGMIFAAITGTPCIVLDSKSPKVRGCYEWIKDLDYIKFCENPEDIERLYGEIPKEERVYPRDRFLPLYAPLVNEILTIRKRKA